VRYDEQRSGKPHKYKKKMVFFDMFEIFDCRQGLHGHEHDGVHAVSRLPPINGLRTWLTNAMSEIQVPGSDHPHELQHLVGFGPGLMPSGDDFLCGERDYRFLL
jgi:hypothetical protein